MAKRKIDKQAPAIRDDIADLMTHRALPTGAVGPIDPFLFLNHHGPQVYPPHNRGLPFGPHPHRGFETVTLILEGDVAHKDSGGHESVITAGGVQWMTAGRGLVHSEISSEAFKSHGGQLEILQLWVNLPAKLKMTEPAYVGLQKNQIPVVHRDGVDLTLIAGAFEKQQGAFSPLLDLTLMTLQFASHSQIVYSVPQEHNIFFYVVRGGVTVNGGEVRSFRIVEFANSGRELEISAAEESLVLLGHAKPIGEPIVAQGPFVMNTRAEILEAIRDFQAGKF